MQEEVKVVVVKENDIYIEVFSGTEEELSSIRGNIKELFENKEIKELTLSKEDYESFKSDINKLVELSEN